MVACPNRCMTRAEAAEELGVSRLRVRSLLRRGRLKACPACAAAGVTRTSANAELFWPTAFPARSRWRRRVGDLSAEILIDVLFRGVAALIGAIIDGF